MAGSCQRHRQATRTGRQLEDRPARPLGEGSVQIEVAWVVGEVEVVEPGEGGGLRRRGRGPDAGPGRASRHGAVRRVVHLTGQPDGPRDPPSDPPWNRTARPAAFLTASAL